MTAWILTIVFMVAAAWSLTEVLALTCPRLTARQRWLVCFWLLATAGALNLAWKAGGA